MRNKYPQPITITVNEYVSDQLSHFPCNLMHLSKEILAQLQFLSNISISFLFFLLLIDNSRHPDILIYNLFFYEFTLKEG